MRFSRGIGAAIGVVALATAAPSAWVSAQDSEASRDADFCIATLEHIAPGSDEARVAHEECYSSPEELYQHVGEGAGDALASGATIPSALRATIDAAIPGAGAGDACVARIEHVRPGSDEARIVSETCFDRLSDAFRVASGGAVNLPDDATQQQAMQALDSLDGTIGTASSFVIGIDWDLASYDPADGIKVWEASSGCGPGVAWNVSNVGGAWDNRIWSAQGKSGCDRFIHFEDTSYGGSSRTCTPNCATMGVMNNATSSLQFKP